ncbi:MAG: ribosome maturation factor RimM [Thermodesulfobacteriota bacterium]
MKFLNRKSIPLSILEMGLLLFGKVLTAHGLSGEVKILPFSREFGNLFGLKRVFIQKKGEQLPCEFKIMERVFQRNCAILKLQGINSAEYAEELKGCTVMVDTSELLELEEDEYYWYQLIGLGVYTTQGTYVGRVENLIDRVQQSLLVIKKGEKEFLVPMVDSIVEEISLENSRIIICPIEGLLD